MEVSNSAKDLLQQLICSVDDRIGRNGFTDFENHRFFHSIDWKDLRQSKKSRLIIKSRFDSSVS